MTIDEFLLLDESQQEDAIQINGLHLATYYARDVMCDAYELFDFYVAFCYELGMYRTTSISAHENPDELPFLIRVKKIFS